MTFTSKGTVSAGIGADATAPGKPGELGQPGPGTAGNIEQIRIHGLTQKFRAVTALHDVTFTLKPGMLGLLGPNGAGKTTLMRILTTVLPPTEGDILVGSYSVRRQPDQIRRMLGYLPQEFGLYGRLTARENLDYFACLRGITDGRLRRRRIDELLHQVNLVSEANRRVAGFSGGMKQRLGIAQALLTDPYLLVVDEPTAGLDPEERVRLRDLLAGFARGRYVILSTHIVDDVEDVCDQLVVLSQGRLAFSGAPEALLSRMAGRVWEVQLEEGELDYLRRRRRVLTTRRRGHRIWARVLGDSSPHPAAERVQPSLEDAYLALMDRPGAPELRSGAPAPGSGSPANRGGG